MKVKQLEKLSIKSRASITIDPRLDAYENIQIPQYKIDSALDTIRNTDFLTVIEKIRKEESKKA
jgi:hypothetical protein